MKMIINQLRYDTATAEEIASWWNGCAKGDFHHCVETLYRTRKGAWFLHGVGGPLSPYAEALENGRSFSGGESLIPLTESGAADWLARHDVALFEVYFAHQAKDA